MTTIILSSYSSRLIPIAHNLKAKHIKGEREILSKKIYNLKRLR
jgi:hypothetical protein